MITADELLKETKKPTTYADVCTKEKAELIGSAARLCGFSDVVKICFYLPEKAGEQIGLRFVVQEVSKQISYKNDCWLAAKLSIALDCDVGITICNSDDDFDSDDIYRRSALITDIKAIKEVIYRITNHIYPETVLSKKDLAAINAIKLEDIVCKNISENDRKMYLASLKNADEYFKKNAEQQQNITVVEAADQYSILDNQQKRKSPEHKNESKKIKSITEDKNAAKHDDLNNVAARSISPKKL